MLVPTLYVCQQVEQSRRREERRDARLWRLLRQAALPSRRSNAVPRRRRAPEANWVRRLLGSPGF